MSENKKIFKNNTLELLTEILLNKNLKKIPKATYFLFVISIVLITIVVNCDSLLVNLKTSYIFDLLSNLLTALGILIGFVISIILTFSTALPKNTVEKLNEHKTDIYADKHNLYETIFYILFEYLYCLAFSLLFIVVCLALRPHIQYFLSYKILILKIFYTFFIILFLWNALSIKSLIYNLYLIIHFNNFANKK